MGLTSSFHQFCFSATIDDCITNSLWSSLSLHDHMDTQDMNQEGDGGDNAYRWFNDYYDMFSCYSFDNNAYGKSRRCFNAGAPNYQMRSNVIIYKLNPPSMDIRDPRKDVMMYKYFRPVHGGVALNLRNRNDRPSFHGNNYALLENSVDNLLPIAYVDIDGSMIKYGNDITCSGNAMTTSEFNGESSLQKCQSICAKNINCVAVTWYENRRFGTRCESHTGCTNRINVPDSNVASLYEKTSTIHIVTVDFELSTPENWESIWTLVSHANDERCHSWCLSQKPFGALNFESSPSYSIALKIEDLNGAHTIGSINIELTNQNERPVIIDAVERFVYEHASSGTLVPPAIEVYDEDVNDAIECRVISGNLVDGSKVPFKWADGTSADVYATDCTLAVNDASIFDFETTQRVFLLSIKARDITSRDPGSMESVEASVTIVMLDINEPPNFLVNNMLVHNDIALSSTNYDISTDTEAIKDVLNGDRFVLHIETTPSDETYPFSHSPLKFQHHVENASTIGFSIGHLESSASLQIRMADGTNLGEKNFAYPKVNLDEQTRRTIIVEKVTGGRKIQVFVNGIESTTGALIATVDGDIYDNGDITFGDVWGWKFKGTLHRIILSKNRMLLPGCTSSCTTSTSHIVHINEGQVASTLIDLHTFASDNDISDEVNTLMFSLPNIYPASGNSIFSLSSTNACLFNVKTSMFRSFAVGISLCRSRPRALEPLILSYFPKRNRGDPFKTKIRQEVD